MLWEAIDDFKECMMVISHFRIASWVKSKVGRQTRGRKARGKSFVAIQKRKARAGAKGVERSRANQQDNGRTQSIGDCDYRWYLTIIGLHGGMKVICFQ